MTEKTISCPECSRVLGVPMEHLGHPCEPGQSIFVPSTDGSAIFNPTDSCCIPDKHSAKVVCNIPFRKK